MSAGLLRSTDSGLCAAFNPQPFKNVSKMGYLLNLHFHTTIAISSQGPRVEVNDSAAVADFE